MYNGPVNPLHENFPGTSVAGRKLIKIVRINSLFKVQYIFRNFFQPEYTKLL